MSDSRYEINSWNDLTTLIQFKAILVLHGQLAELMENVSGIWILRDSKKETI